MRVLIMLALIIVIVFTVSFSVQKTLDTSSQRLSEDLEKIKAAITNNQLTKAESLLNNAHPTWEKIRKKWSFITDHREIDMIETSWVRFESCLQQKEKSQALQELAAIMRIVKHIPIKEKLQLENVF